MTKPPNVAEQANREFVGERLRSWRLRRGFSQQRLADAIGVTQASLSNYENGKRELSLSATLAATEALDVSMTELVPIEDTAIIVLKDSRLGRALQTLSVSADQRLAG